VNNLNDGMVWGLLPLMLAQRSFSLSETGLLAAVYPAVWGVSQIFTGRLSDYVCKKDLLMWGMILQGVALFGLSYSDIFSSFAVGLSMLGFGTALVYPTFLASIADNTHPHDRAHSLGVFRFWRDMGYAAGALLCGVLADYAGISFSFMSVGLITVLTGFGANYRMRCRTSHPELWPWIRSGISRTGAKFRNGTRNFNSVISVI
jgi:MFS family permease